MEMCFSPSFSDATHWIQQSLYAMLCNIPSV